LSTYYDLMVGRLTKPVVLYCAVTGAWLGTQDPADAPLGVHRLRLLGRVRDHAAWPGPRGDDRQDRPRPVRASAPPSCRTRPLVTSICSVRGLGDTKGGYFKVELYPNSSHTKARALCQAKGKSGSAKLVGTTNLADGALHTITCEKKPNAFNMYVDGVLKASKPNTLGSITTTEPLTIGAKNIGGDWYDGFMDEASLTIG
jgi:hypothetical protein